ncbi:FAD-dependent thymidylate synthase [Faecalibacterium sp. OF04-11AC]|uniref:FAD-dependent thymidylate synthase n=1 Tax=Faecalibacterium sp. OF04-11AC TaxID=2293109 RepID=UPI000E9635C9|nr:FAD-dependent thymidylate synthase [Faecalibacterium sp. OF04-11AC]RGF78649.1 FAD-dependent thymidylate synthase [Faecalibacterium sp. OF04-11AC]
MKIVEPKYEILTDISEGGIKELQQIERVARVCYKSEDKITPDGESAKKLVGFLVKQGHEAMLEHSQLSVLFTCDRAIANELVRHRIASFAQESTRYCNYSTEKFGGELSFIRPYYIPCEPTEKAIKAASSSEDFIKLETDYQIHNAWYWSCDDAEKRYKILITNGLRPEQARCVLPLCLKTEIVVTANYREWRNIFKLRTPAAAHPQMRELMCPLLHELQKKIPVVFDDIQTLWPADDQTRKGSMVK